MNLSAAPTASASNLRVLTLRAADSGLSMKAGLTGTTCVSFLQMFPQTPSFSLGSGTDTLSIHGSRKPAGTIYTHNWGAER